MLCSSRFKTYLRDVVAGIDDGDEDSTLSSEVTGNLDEILTCMIIETGGNEVRNALLDVGGALPERGTARVHGVDVYIEPLYGV